MFELLFHISGTVAFTLFAICNCGGAVEEVKKFFSTIWGDGSGDPE